MSTEPLTQTPAARRTDPVSSHLAAEAMDASGRRASQQHRVLRAVRRYPGRTSAELAELIGMDRYAVARRLPELEPRHVEKGPIRICEARGTRATTWWPTREDA